MTGCGRSAFVRASSLFRRRKKERHKNILSLFPRLVGHVYLCYELKKKEKPKEELMQVSHLSRFLDGRLEDLFPNMDWQV